MSLHDQSGLVGILLAFIPELNVYFQEIKYEKISIILAMRLRNIITP
jgi:hypothetical protein